jgi:hypothetical protein
MDNRYAHAVRGSRVRNGGWHHRLAARGLDQIPVSAADKARIAHGNAERLFR